MPEAGGAGAGAPSVVGALLRPTARAVDWTAPVAGAGVALALVGGSVLSQPDAPVLANLVSLRVGMAVLAVAAALAMPDPAEPTAAATPTPRRRRWAVRSAVVIGGWAAGWIAALAVGATAGGPTPGLALSVEAVGWLAVAVLLGRIGGSGMGVAGVLALWVALPLARGRWAVVPADPQWSALHARWLGLAMVAAAAVAASYPDPPRR